MTFLHLISDSLKNKEENNDSTDKMGPNVDSLVVCDKERLEDTLWIVMIEAISF